MIGAGVFLSAGFMAQDLDPPWILLAWLAGSVIALAGARAYGALAEIVPRSGGEYRFLSDLLHPFAGYTAGWTSLLVGFSAPIAVDALVAGAFLKTLIPAVEPLAVAVVLVVVLTALHAARLTWSRRTQNVLVVIKLLLILAFVFIGLGMGSMEWPQWQAPNRTAGFPLAPFMGSLFFIAFAFSGWNAAAYAAEEFRSPREVSRAMLLGCGFVAVLYLILNWILVANLTPERATVVFTYETARITLGHLVMTDLLGPRGAAVMSTLIIIAFISAMSAMILAGPRVYAAMAADGFLPRILLGRDGSPPVGSIILQGVIALVIVFTHDVRTILLSMGAILTLFSALTCLSLILLWFRPGDRPRPDTTSAVAAAIHFLSGCWMLYFGFRQSAALLMWVAAGAAAAFVAYRMSRKASLA